MKVVFDKHGISNRDEKTFSIVLRFGEFMRKVKKRRLASEAQGRSGERQLRKGS